MDECGAAVEYILKYGGRRPLLGSEDGLIELIYEKRIRKENVNRARTAPTAIQLFQASRTAEEHEDDPDPWVHNFMVRNNFTFPKRTNLTTQTNEVMVDLNYEFGS
ncbi:hypothetical protein PHYSODRAFT_299119 [Phytophthora sojae]|uniref:HTH CENPB-type domain-containing protein n=1 Tax=Phytophthora sojae (strain P6497) TaxID=1094619 RepID=G4Z234_PHYSP|nr:hypothetical protein PHYSODRAFT_299119 [Phytophthora sojae]EGZ21369.1 hypothetical protein PHYSODRAFT_299119 [Phytophthora sojae]|eukprot:XP_009524086.1 hypothetical protein PHYSODRAFT_299119 [Phytophthora sojae]